MDHLGQIIFVIALILSALSSARKKTKLPGEDEALNRRLEEALKESLRRKSEGAAPGGGGAQRNTPPILKVEIKRVPRPDPAAGPAAPPPARVPPPPIPVAMTRPTPNAPEPGEAARPTLPSPSASLPGATPRPAAAPGYQAAALIGGVAGAAPARRDAGSSVGLGRAAVQAAIVPVGTASAGKESRRVGRLLGDPKQLILASVILEPPLALRRRFSGRLDRPIS